MSWYVKSFGARYRQLYSHRDLAEAERALDLLTPSTGWAGRRALDLACGAGRYLRALRRRGVTAVGADLSPVLLAEARGASPGEALLRADMRAIPLRDSAVEDCLSMFTSFGYFESEPEHALLAGEMARVSRRRAIVDIPNPKVLEETLVEKSERRLEDLLLRESRWLETQPMRVCKRIELVGPAGTPVERYDERVMLFEQKQLMKYFAPHGFELQRCHGSYEGEEFERDRSPRQICVFVRQAA